MSSQPSAKAMTASRVIPITSIHGIGFVPFSRRVFDVLKEVD
jgi:hypothetical protein